MFFIIEFSTLEWCGFLGVLHWVNIENKLHIKYHDEEWGQPVHNDKILFEMLIFGRITMALVH